MTALEPALRTMPSMQTLKYETVSLVDSLSLRLERSHVRPWWSATVCTCCRLSSTALGPAGATSLARPLQSMTKLVTLVLAMSDILSAGVAAVAAALLQTTTLQLLEYVYHAAAP